MKQNNGFSLLELMIVITILTILSSVGYPLYTQHLSKLNRLAAQQSLSQLALAMERYHFEHNTYAGASLSQLNMTEYTAKNAYRLAIQSSTHHHYVLTAHPLNPQAERDDCGELILDAQGKRSQTGSASSDDCWQ